MKQANLQTVTTLIRLLLEEQSDPLGAVLSGSQLFAMGKLSENLGPYTVMKFETAVEIIAFDNRLGTTNFPKEYVRPQMQDFPEAIIMILDANCYSFSLHLS